MAESIHILKRMALGVALLAVTSLLAPLAAQDFVRMSDYTLMGTARYVGMSGAMTAVGGDPTSVADNPAGLGLYRRPELMFSFDYAWDRTWQDPSRKEYRNRFFFPQFSLVLNLGNNNLMISYRRLHTYNRALYATGEGDRSLGALLATTGVDFGMPYSMDRLNRDNQLGVYESGYINEYAFDWAVNLYNRLYVGLGVHMHSHTMRATSEYVETFHLLNDASVRYYNANSTVLEYSGIGCTFAAGLIYRPVSWFRAGFGITTPSITAMRIYSSGKLSAQTDSLRSSLAPDITTKVSNFHRPLHTSVSLAFQAGRYGMLAFQYDYNYRFGERDWHSLRAGIEIVPVAGLYINAGYAYESTFRANDATVPIDPSFDRQDAYFQRMHYTQYASAAIGFRGRHAIVQAAYQYRWQRLDLYAHENANPYDMRTATHRLVLTIGWHRGW